MNLKTKNLEDLVERALTLTEQVRAEPSISEELWREASNLASRITQHQAIWSDDDN